MSVKYAQCLLQCILYIICLYQAIFLLQAFFDVGFPQDSDYKVIKIDLFH